MKMKKFVLLLSMLLFTFSLTACNSGQDKVDFDYTDLEVLNYSVVLTFNIQGIDEATKMQINHTEGQEVYQTAISNFDTARDECGELLGFRTKMGNMISLQEIAVASQDQESYNQYLMDIDSEVKEDGNRVRATIVAVYEDRDVRLGFLFESAPQSASLDQMTGALIIPFDISEITVSPIYSFKETMSKAAMNTLMGMGTVFAVLIIIAVIIGQFEWLSAVIMKVSDAIGAFFEKRRKRRAEKKAAKQAKKAGADVSDTLADIQTESAVAVAASPADNLVNDAELVAVITAAIMAAQGGALSSGSDGLIVRSIRKAKR